MFFVLPSGHSHDVVRKVPWVTIVILALCLLVQIYASLRAPTEHDYEVVLIPYAELQMEVLAELGAEDLPLDEQDALVESFARGELTDDDDPLLVEYRNAETAFERLMERDPVLSWGYRPGARRWWTLITSAFVHAGWMHLLGNMLFLYLTGFNLEDRWSSAGFLGFYLVGAVVAGVGYSLWHPDSDVLLVGASGAISAAMGAFAVVLGATKIRFIYLLWLIRYFHVGRFDAPAYVALPLWFIIQAFWSIFEYEGLGSGVAYSAHVSGFAFGVVVALTLRLTGLDAKLDERHDEVLFEVDPSVANAAKVAGDDPIAAVSILRQSIEQRTPEHAMIEQLCRIVEHAPATPQIANEVDRCLQSMARRGDHHEVVTVFETITRQRDPLVLDRSYLVTLQAARALGRAELVVDIARALMQAHPRSPVLPRALWDVAEVQRAAGRPDLSRNTLASLALRYPDDPFGKMAAERSN